MLNENQRNLLNEMLRELLLDELGFYRIGKDSHDRLLFASKLLLAMDLHGEDYFPQIIYETWEKRARERIDAYKRWWSWAVMGPGSGIEFAKLSIKQKGTLLAVEKYLNELELGEESEKDMVLHTLYMAYRFYAALPYSYSDKFVATLVNGLHNSYQNVLAK